MKFQVFIDVDAVIKLYWVSIVQKVCLIMKVLITVDFFLYVFCDFKLMTVLVQDSECFCCYFHLHFYCFIIIDFLMTKIDDYFLRQLFQVFLSFQDHLWLQFQFCQKILKGNQFFWQAIELDWTKSHLLIINFFNVRLFLLFHQPWLRHFMSVYFFQIVCDNSTTKVVPITDCLIIFRPFLTAYFRVIIILTVRVSISSTMTVFIIVQFVFYFFVLFDELQVFMMIVIMRHFVALITLGRDVEMFCYGLQEIYKINLYRVMAIMRHFNDVLMNRFQILSYCGVFRYAFYSF